MERPRVFRMFDPVQISMMIREFRRSSYLVKETVEVDVKDTACSFFKQQILAMPVAESV